MLRGQRSSIFFKGKLREIEIGKYLSYSFNQEFHKLRQSDLKKRTLVSNCWREKKYDFLLKIMFFLLKVLMNKYSERILQHSVSFR